MICRLKILSKAQHSIKFYVIIISLCYSQLHSLGVEAYALFKRNTAALRYVCANILKEDKQVVLCGGGVCLALLVASVTTLITVALMFNNTMFGKAGYLTLTLPVKINSLLASKTVSGLIWIFSVYALLIGSLVLWLYQIKTILGDQMTDTIDSLLEIFGVPSVKTITIGIIIACILFVLQNES